MRILLTGAGGMLGRATAKALIARGDQVTVLQRRPSGLDCAEVLGDITDSGAMRAAAARADAVLHLAAKVDIVGRWAEFVRVNVEGTRSVLAAAQQAGVSRFVHVSSPSVAHRGAAVMGQGAEPADPKGARSNYARTKAMAENLALEADTAGFPVLCIRPHLVWGPGDTQLIGPVLARARAGRLPLIGTGAALVDTTYLDNAVDALIAAVDHCGPVHGESLVVSNGEPRSVGDILRSVCAAAGIPGPRRSVPLPLAKAAGAAVETVWRATGRTDRPPMTTFLAEQLGTAHWFDQRRTRQALGWTPRIPLDRGFQLLRHSFLREHVEQTRLRRGPLGDR